MTSKTTITMVSGQQVCTDESLLEVLTAWKHSIRESEGEAAADVPFVVHVRDREVVVYGRNIETMVNTG